MSALLLSRIDTDALYQPFLTRLQGLLDEAMAQHRPYWVVEGYRTYDRSDTLFAQGRSTPGPIVTNARGGQSAHNFGIAADLVLDGYLDRAGLQPDYRPASYDLLGQFCPLHGLVWGGSWVFKDRPHVQMPGFVTAKDMEPLRLAFHAAGMRGVFTYLDSVVQIPLPAT